MVFFYFKLINFFTCLIVFVSMTEIWSVQSELTVF